MRVRRDYSRPLFSTRRRSSSFRGIFVLMVLILGIVFVVSWRFDDLQSALLSSINIAAESTPMPVEYATEGANAFVRGDLEGARLAFSRAIAQAPDNIDYLYEYGKVLIELDETNEAVAIADRIIQVNPNEVRGHALRANALKWSDPATAIQDALRAIDINPNYSPVHAALAVSYANIQRYQQAIDSGAKAIELDARDADAYRANAWPLILVGRWEEAIENLETAVSINPNLTGPYFQLAFEYKHRADDPAMAIAIYQHIIDNMNPSPADAAKAYLRICETYANVENAEFDRAEPFCRQAIEIDPSYGSAYRELGRMQYNRRNYEGAIESFETCASLQSDQTFKDIECWSLRGLAHYWMAQCDDAWNVLSTALDIADVQGEQQGTIDTINTGIYNVTQKCTDYIGLPTPTPILPTAIPPTPIGGI